MNEYIINIEYTLCHCFQMSNCGVKVRDLSSVVILFANKFGGLNVFYFILFSFIFSYCSQLSGVTDKEVI